MSLLFNLIFLYSLVSNLLGVHAHLPVTKRDTQKSDTSFHAKRRREKLKDILRMKERVKDILRGSNLKSKVSSYGNVFNV